MSSEMCPDGLLYAVRPGQTLDRIARQFSVTVTELRESNPGLGPRELQVGQIVCVPGVAEHVCSRGALRVVEPGETLYRIARETGRALRVLIEANTWLPDPATVYPGEQVCLPPPVPPPGCSIALEPTGAAADFEPGGVALIEELEEESRLTFAVVNLPTPGAFGDFDIFAGELVFRETGRLIPLNRCTPTTQRQVLKDEGQLSVYAGGAKVDLPALGANMVAVFPFNTLNETRGPDLLQGWLIDCR